MNCSNRRLLLPLEDDGLTVDDIILVYHNHSLIGYTTKERNRKSQPCHAKSLIELGRHPCSARHWSLIPRPTPMFSSSFVLIINPPLPSSPPLSPPSSSLYIVVTLFNIRGGERSQVCRCIVAVILSYDPPWPWERSLKDDEPVLVAHQNSRSIRQILVIPRKSEPSEMQSHG